jgi:glycosyltransferase involved in cell wall biosynthesis
LPPQANGNDYATIIAELLNDKTKLSALKRSSRRQFEEKLNWDNWGNNFKAIIEKLVSQKK